MRNPSPYQNRHPKALAIVERRTKVFELRLKGWRYDQIAKELGITVHKVKRDIKARARIGRSQMEAFAAEAVSLDLDRLETLLQGAWAKASEGDPKSIDSVLRILERRSKILGYDKPVHSTSSTTVMYGQLTGPELLDSADRLGLEVSPELRIQLAGATAAPQRLLPHYEDTHESPDTETT